MLIFFFELIYSFLNFLQHGSNLGRDPWWFILMYLFFVFGLVNLFSAFSPVSYYLDGTLNRKSFWGRILRLILSLFFFWLWFIFSLVFCVSMLIDALEAAAKFSSAL